MATFFLGLLGYGGGTQQTERRTSEGEDWQLVEPKITIEQLRAAREMLSVDSGSGIVKKVKVKFAEFMDGKINAIDPTGVGVKSKGGFSMVGSLVI